MHQSYEKDREKIDLLTKINIDLRRAHVINDKFKVEKSGNNDHNSGESSYNNNMSPAKS